MIRSRLSRPMLARASSSGLLPVSSLVSPLEESTILRCKVHGRPLKPSRIKQGNKTWGCSKCNHQYADGKSRPDRQRYRNRIALQRIELNRRNRDPFKPYRGMSKLDQVLSGISTHGV